MTGVTLRLDTAAWRSHLRCVADATPGMVPVIKGNGYGFGLARLAAEAQTLGQDTIAVGLSSEVALVRDAFAGDVVVLTPWRPDDELADELSRDPRVITTVSRLVDLSSIADRAETAAAGGTTSRPRVLLEAMTSMLRHGLPTAELAGVAAYADRVTVEGWTIHLPIAGDPVAEGIALAQACHGALIAPLWLSHFPAQAVTRLPDVAPVRLRTGTRLWLGAPATRSTTATVLDVHPVRRGDLAGYRRRRVPHDGWVLVIAGGTSHGVGMEAPTSASTPRQRAVSLFSGGLAATGHALSPYTVDGKKRWFVEPPHMQSSLVLLPAAATPPTIGDDVTVELRLTTAQVDQIDER